MPNLFLVKHACGLIHDLALESPSIFCTNSMQSDVATLSPHPQNNLLLTHSLYPNQQFGISSDSQFIIRQNGRNPCARIRAIVAFIAKRSNIGSNRPFSPRRGAEQRAVVDASPAHTVRSVSEAFVCRPTHPARCEHRRMKRGAGASVFGYFWGNCQK